MQEQYYKYTYDGPVMRFNNYVTDRWKGETMAPSEKKARSNLIYQAKKQLNLIASARITLPGKIKMIN